MANIDVRLFQDFGRKELWNLATIVWAALLAGGALVLEYGFDLEPCPLCLNQRLWVMLAGLLATVGFIHNPRLGVYPLLAILAAGAGAFFSLRHLYLLTLPPEQLPSCIAGMDYLIEVFPLMDVLRVMVEGSGDCADQGFAIPALALVGFIGLVAMSLLSWRGEDDS